MKKSKLYVSLFAFAIAIAAAFTSNATVDAPFFGELSSNCVEGTISHSNCNQSSGTRCTVNISGSVVNAFDDDSGTTCATPVYRGS